MKKILIISALIITACNIKAQGTLQFNQTKLIDNNAQSVPSGKVWKVVSCLPISGPIVTSGSAAPSPGLFSILVNSTSIYVSTVNAAFSPTGYGQNNYNTYTSVNDGIFPMWLPANTTLAAGSNIKYLSIIEFNIIP